MHDLRLALRQLVKFPGFTAITVLTLALGIGACTAIFSIVNAVLLRPPDFFEPEKIVVLREQFPSGKEVSASAPNFLDWEKRAASFSSLAAYTGASFNLTGEAEPQQLSGARVTAGYFTVFGIRPVLGRTFLSEEDVPGRDRVAVLSFSLWQRVFGGATDIVGRSLQIDGEACTVIGVVPPGPGRTDIWRPMAFTSGQTAEDNRGAHWLNVAARLKPGVTAAQAGAELTVIAAQLAQQYPADKDQRVVLVPLLDYNVRGARAGLLTLLGAVGCVLAIACANVANLLLARATGRIRELSIRAALGATRARLIRQLLTESVLLGLLGGSTGLLLARWGLDALTSLAPPTFQRMMADVPLDPVVLGFALALSVATGLLFGLAPAWLAARADVSDAIKQGARGSTEGGARRRLRSTLVVFEVATTLMLLAAAGLLGRSLISLAQLDPGFLPENATVLRLSLPAKKYPQPEQQAAFAETLLARVRDLPGVQAAGVAHLPPLIGFQTNGFTVQGQPVPANLPITNYFAVTPGFFPAMGIRLVHGRFFNAQDDARAPRVTIVNETLARLFFPGENPIGRQISFTDGDEAWREIVGVVAGTTQDVTSGEASNQSYEPFAQRPGNGINLIVRTVGGGATAVAGLLRSAVYDVDKDQPVGSILSLEEILAGGLARQRFTILLLTVFSLVALVIATVGIYGAIAYNVTQRTGEFGIRLALGAQPRDVLRLVFAQGGRLIGLGLVLGLALTLGSTRVLQSLLAHTNAHDPATLGAVVLLFTLIAFLACWIPARRATKVDPIIALRAE